MTKQEADWLSASMKKQGWTEVRVEPSVGEGYAVAFRRLPAEAYRYARCLGPAIRARYRSESVSSSADRKRTGGSRDASEV